jgi:hypothetical protein
MPALPWLAVGTPDPDADLIVMASRLSLRSHGDIPRFLRHTWLIRRQLVRSPGLIGYSLDAHLLAKPPGPGHLRPDKSARGGERCASIGDDAVDVRDVAMPPGGSADHLGGGP